MAGADAVGHESTMPAGRWAWAEIDHDAIAHNVGVFRRLAAPADVWAVIKADGYGHGMVEVAHTVLAAGAVGLCVALVQEGVELRDAGIAVPILVLSQQPPPQFGELIDQGLTPTIYTASAIAALATAARERGCGSGQPPVAVHLKIDTGMHRVGATPDEVAGLVDAVRASDSLRLAGVFTHLAAADDPGHPANETQLAVFAAAVVSLNLSEDVAVHAVNSAGAIAFPAAHHSLVRIGIALYGISPSDELQAALPSVIEQLRPALSLHARVSHVKQIQPGDGVSYGLRFVAAEPMWVATVPIGYADGVPRVLAFGGGEVLLGGVRRRILGVVTMDQIIVVCDADTQVGDRVVLLGRQGDDEVRAEEWAARVGTIGYEIVCGISRRITRHHRGGGGRH